MIFSLGTCGWYKSLPLPQSSISIQWFVYSRGLGVHSIEMLELIKAGSPTSQCSEAIRSIPIHAQGLHSTRAETQRLVHAKCALRSLSNTPDPKLCFYIAATTVWGPLWPGFGVRGNPDWAIWVFLYVLLQGEPELPEGSTGSLRTATASRCGRVCVSSGQRSSCPCSPWEQGCRRTFPSLLQPRGSQMDSGGFREGAQPSTGHSQACLEGPLLASGEHI